VKNPSLSTLLQMFVALDTEATSSEMYDHCWRSWIQVVL